MAGWYVRRGERITGPLRLDTLKKLADDGQLRGTDELSRTSAGPWRAASESKLLAKTEPTALIVVARKAMPLAKATLTTTGEVISVVSGRSAQAFAVLGRGIVHAWAVRSQRKHEMRMARIQAQSELAIAEALRPPAPVVAQPTREIVQVPVYIPQTVPQTTIVNVAQSATASTANESSTASGCGCLLFVLAIGVALLIAL